MKKICVMGSINVDLTVSIPRFHAPGETIEGTNFATFTGGKGGNQAIAAARLGADVTLVGAIGEDDFGRSYLETFRKEGVNPAGVAVVPGVSTGTALIEVAADGDNRIAYIPGANGKLTETLIDAQRTLIESAGVFMFQMETYLPGAFHAARLAHEAGACVILDPAPAQPVSADWLSYCDYITPNETELALLTGMPVKTIEDAEAAARKLISMGAKAVLNKRGPQGVLLVTAEGSQLFKGFKVNAVDTTAAGDSFNAGFAVGLAMGDSLPDAIRLGNAVGALSTTAAGAQAAMPTMAAAKELMDSQR